MKVEIRRRLCACDKWLSLKVEIYEEAQLAGRIGEISTDAGESRSVNFFSKRCKKHKRKIRGRHEDLFVFCVNCNRRSQVKTFKP